MAGQDDISRLAELRELWRRWTGVVELFGRRRRGRRRVDPRGYALLHRDLLEACQALSGSAEGDRAALYENLAALARPWLTPQVLARTDREILIDLMLQCGQAGERLGIRPPGRAAWRLVAALGLVAAVALALAAVPPDWSGDVVLRSARGWSDTAWLTV